MLFKRSSTGTASKKKAQTSSQQSRFVARISLILFSVVCIVGTLYAMRFQAQQWAERAFTGTMADQGFAYNDLSVEGIKRTNFDDVWHAVPLDEGEYIFQSTLETIRHAVSRLPWVESVVVRRHLPGRIILRITERTPLFIWQHDRKLSLVDTHGKVIQTSITTEFSMLPHVVGHGAEKKGSELLKSMAPYPNIVKQVKSSHLIGARRFDLQFKNGLLVQLPEQDLSQALGKLDQLLKTDGKAQAGRIDLRVPGKVFVTPFSQRPPLKSQRPS